MKWRNSNTQGQVRPVHPYDWASNEHPDTPMTKQVIDMVGVAIAVLVAVGGLAAIGWIAFGGLHRAGATDLDCRPTITGPYADYDGQAAVTLTVPDYCTVSQQVRLVVFSLPAGVTALTPEAADVDQTPTVIVDATLEPGVPNTVDPGELHGCGDLQIDVAPNNADWASLQVGVVAPHNLPGAYTASAEHADGQCHPCTFAVPVPDVSPSVEEHDDAPCGAPNPAVGAPGEQTGPVIGVPVLSAATPQNVTSPPPSAGVASSGTETTTVPLDVVSVPAAPNTAAAFVELPNTGIDIRWALGTAIVLVLVGWLLVLVGPDIFRGKEKRS